MFLALTGCCGVFTISGFESCEATLYEATQHEIRGTPVQFLYLSARAKFGPKLPIRPSGMQISIKNRQRLQCIGSGFDGSYKFSCT